ncbi:MAG TPA: branched-chain amino acid ABC transporter permease, partial [Bacilli bacterium]|nr:branched-chain amino acid ABC transporter permease [Bacilli bacterium]
MKALLQSKKTWIFLFVIFTFVYPFITGQSGYLMTLFVMIAVYSITAMALNLLTGYGGQISIGHAGF